jgi:Tol biopolymer transport system component
VLAVARPGGGVRTIDVDQRRVLWSSRERGPRVRALSWSGDGRRLLAMAAHDTRVLDVAGRVRQRVAAPAGSTFVSAAFAPRGPRIAFVRRHRGVSQLMLAAGAAGDRPRLLFAGAGDLDAVTWSPDGRWLLVAWPTSDQFLFVRTSGPARVQAVPAVAREFDPRARGAAGAPRPSGWCCRR